MCFWAFFELLDCSYESIHLCWVADLNLNEEARLAFVCGREQLWAMHNWRLVNKALFGDIVGRMKTKCLSPWTLTFTYFHLKL
jgi:hypothetical protein